MVRNIIEDSDDEGDFGALSPVVSTGRTASPTPPDARRYDQQAQSQKSPPGTSSTEQLRRDIAAAHQDVIDKSAAPNGSANSPNDYGRWNSPVTSRKRNSTQASLESNVTLPPAAKKPERRKTPKTYSHSDRSRNVADESNGAFEAMRHEDVGEQIWDNGFAAQHNETSETWYLVGNNQAVLPEMPPSLEEDFMQHNPAVMFPTTMSSTVPDATISQQQLIDAARAEYLQNQLASPSGLAAKIIENPSVSWSDHLESTEKDMRSSQNGFGKFHQQSQRSAARSQSVYSGIAQNERLPHFDGNASTSPVPTEPKRSNRRSKTTPHPRLSQSSHDELGEEMLSSNSAPSSKRRKESLEESGMTRSQKAIDDSIEESIRAVRASKAAKAKVQESSEPLNSDDIAIGLPKEKYVPRPSRSRSARSTVEEPDYSVVPEKVARAKNKRRKTVDTLIENIATVEPVECGSSDSRDFGQTSGGEPIQSLKHKKTADHTDLTITGDKAFLETRQKSAPTQPKRKRGRPPKNPPKQPLQETEEEEEDFRGTAHLGDVDELQQVMPLSDNDHDVDQQFARKEELLHGQDSKNDDTRPRLPSPFVQPTPTSSAQQKVVAESEMQQAEPRAKKEGRGRPRSKHSIGTGAINVDEPSATTEDHTAGEDGETQEIQENTKSKDERSNDEQTMAEGGEEANSGAAGNASSALGASRPVEQPSKEHEEDKDKTGQKDAASRASAQPSPLGKGKVPLRVGLSRKARIAPLLKIVKK